jgi:hypothetical protein
MQLYGNDSEMAQDSFSRLMAISPLAADLKTHQRPRQGLLRAFQVETSLAYLRSRATASCTINFSFMNET